MTRASQLRVRNNHYRGALEGSSVTNALNSGDSSARLATRYLIEFSILTTRACYLRAGHYHDLRLWLKLHIASAHAQLGVSERLVVHWPMRLRITQA